MIELFLLAIAPVLGNASPNSALQRTPTTDDGLPRLQCDTNYTNLLGKRVNLPLKITFGPMARGVVPLSPSGLVLYGNATFAFSGTAPIEVTQIVPSTGEAATDSNLQSLFKFNGGIFSATTTMQNLDAKIALIEINFTERLVPSGRYQNWTAHCRQVSGFYSKSPH
ncbi:hypothetical protein [Sphingomonas albertensis]|uniref:Uncharacterized protein n=1 Tax=Sphingomonas albertensis TaxID=2762591 RepID=A0ABR7AR65_9SPHN|nr:hypothetical protein [Sphingomonas albertensis]MBC3942945.1 hypothetical protein [Sphingomonas albertensis]